MEPKDQKKSEGLDYKLIEGFIGMAVKAFTAVAGVSALLYATGFLVVNINLLSLGAYEVGLLRERFVTAGIIFLSTFGFIFFMTIVVSDWIENGRFADPYNRVLLKFVGPMIVMLLFLYLFILAILPDSLAYGRFTGDIDTLNKVLFYLTRLAVVVLTTLLVSALGEKVLNFFFSARFTDDSGKSLNSNHFSAIKLISKLIFTLVIVIPILLMISSALDINTKELMISSALDINTKDMIIAKIEFTYAFLGIIVFLTLLFLELMDALIGHSCLADNFEHPDSTGRKEVLLFGTFIGTMIIMIFVALFLSLISSGLRLQTIPGYITHLNKAAETALPLVDFKSLEEGFEAFYKPLTTRIIAWSLIFGFFIYFLRYAFKQNDPPDKDANQAKRIINNFLDRKWPIPYSLLILFLSLYFFSRDIYVAYPPALGGGLPIVVQFLAKEDHHLRLKQLGIFETDDTLALSPKVDLVAQTGSHYIVLVFNAELNQRIAVSFPKEYVDGVKFSPEEYYLNDKYVAGRRTVDGHALLAKGDYAGSIVEFKKALGLVEDYIPALIGLGDSFVKQAEVDFESCKNVNCHAEAICRYIKVIDSQNSESDETPIASISEIADAHYQLARALAIFNDKLSADGFSEERIKAHLIRTQICGDQIKEREDKNDTVDATKNLLTAINLVENPTKYQDKAIMDKAFDDHQYWTNADIYNSLFTTTKNAATRYSKEGKLAKEAEELETAINWYFRAILLAPKFTDPVQGREEEARLRYLLAGIYMDLWQQGRVADFWGWQCNEEGIELKQCSLENLIIYEADSSIEQAPDECEDAAADLQECTIEIMIVNEYSKSITRAPDNPTYRIALAEAHLQFENTGAAIDTYQRLLSANTGYVPALLGLGEVYLLNRSYIEAMDSFQKAINQQPENAAAIFAYARAMALLYQQSRPTAYYGSELIQSPLKNDDINKICPHLRKAVNLDSIYLKQAEDEEAFVPFQDCLSAAQSFETGESLESEGDIEAAISFYNDAVGLEPYNAAYWSTLANAYRRLGLPSETENAYENAITNDKNNDNYHYGFGTFYLKQGRYDQAIKKLLEAIALEDSKAIYYANLGEAYRLRNNEDDLPEAIDSYNQAIKLDEEYGDAYCGLGISYEKSAQVEDALAALEVCINKSQNDNLKSEAQEIIKKHLVVEDTSDASEQDGGE